MNLCFVFHPIYRHTVSESVRSEAETTTQPIILSFEQRSHAVRNATATLARGWAADIHGLPFTFIDRRQSLHYIT